MKKDNRKKGKWLTFTFIISLAFFATAMLSIHICHDARKNATGKVYPDSKNYNGIVVGKKTENQKNGTGYYIKLAIESSDITIWESISKNDYHEVSVGDSVNVYGYNGYYALNKERVIDKVILKYSNTRSIVVLLSLYAIILCMQSICFFLMSGNCIKTSKSYFTMAYSEIVFGYIYFLVELFLILMYFEYKEAVFLMVAVEVGAMFLVTAMVVHLGLRSSRYKVKGRTLYIKKGLFGVQKITFDELNEARRCMMPFMYRGSVYVKIPGDYIQLNLGSLLGGFDFVQRLFRQLQWDNEVEIEVPQFYRYGAWSRRELSPTSVNDAMYEKMHTLLVSERKTKS